MNQILRSSKDDNPYFNALKKPAEKFAVHPAVLLDNFRPEELNSSSC
jgi:hypothetical protein